MKQILNLTQHKASADQLTVGVVDIADLKIIVADNIAASGGDVDGYLAATPDQEWLSSMLTFDTLPSKPDLSRRAKQIVAGVKTLAQSYDGDDLTVMIGGAPFFMPVLQVALQDAGITPMLSNKDVDSLADSQAKGSFQDNPKHVTWVKAQDKKEADALKASKSANPFDCLGAIKSKAPSWASQNRAKRLAMQKVKK